MPKAKAFGKGVTEGIRLTRGFRLLGGESGEEAPRRLPTKPPTAETYYARDLIIMDAVGLYGKLLREAMNGEGEL